MTDEILVHRMLGSWAVEYKASMTPAAFDELTHRTLLLVAAERERCAMIAETHAAQCEQRMKSPQWGDKKEQLLSGAAAAAVIAGQIRRP